MSNSEASTDLATVETRRVDLDGPGVQYLVAGDGSPLVFVHGGMDSSAVS